MTEIAISERREAEISQLGFIALLHRRGEENAFFVSAQSLQRPTQYDDADGDIERRYLGASALSVRQLPLRPLPEMHGSRQGRIDDVESTQAQQWLTKWLRKYVDGSPETSSQDWKASHPAGRRHPSRWKTNRTHPDNTKPSSS